MRLLLVVALPGCGLSERHGARDVGGAVKIARSGVDKQQAVGRHCRIGSRGGGVVDYGSVGAVAGYGLEALVEIERLLRAVVRKYVGYIHFGDAPSGGHVGLYLHECFYERRSVAAHCLADSLDLHLILAPFEQSYGRGALNGSWSECAGDVASGLRRAYEYFRVAGEPCKKRKRAVVGHRGYAASFEIGSYVGRKFTRVDK